MKATLQLERALVLVLGLYLAGTGGLALGRGHWLYTDYLGQRVPAPVALLLGATLLAIGTVLWSRLPWRR